MRENMTNVHASTKNVLNTDQVDSRVGIHTYL